MFPPTFWELVSRRSAADPDGPMLIDDRGRTVSFGEYAEAAERTAAGLAAAGIGARGPVAWQLPSWIETYVLMAALSRLGVVQVPIIPILRRSELTVITARTGCGHLLVPPELRGFDHAGLAQELAGEIGFEAVVLDRNGPTGDHGLALPDGDPAELPAPPGPPTDGADPTRWIYFTSGTTGEPKGARHTDRSVMAGGTGFVTALAMNPDDVMAGVFPVSHIGGIAILSSQLASGFRIATVETFDPAATPRFLADNGVTVLGSAVPFFMAFLAAQEANGPAALFPRLRFCANGGAPCPPAVHERLKTELGAGIVSGWGLTECPTSSFASPDDDDEVRAHTCGRPVPGIDLRVVGADEQTLGPGQEGELRLKGPQLFQGYVGGTGDAEAFDRDGYFRTGDLGIVDDGGNVRITGRLKDIIIRNAENISAEEVENALFDHPKVADVAVIGLPDAGRGERVCAVVQARPGDGPPTLVELAEQCRRKGLSDRKFPEQLEVVPALPRNAMGKIQKQALRTQFAAEEANSTQ